jgi:hypothetical protein
MVWLILAFVCVLSASVVAKRRPSRSTSAREREIPVSPDSLLALARTTALAWPVSDADAEIIGRVGEERWSMALEAALLGTGIVRVSSLAGEHQMRAFLENVVPRIQARGEAMRVAVLVDYPSHSVMKAVIGVDANGVAKAIGWHLMKTLFELVPSRELIDASGHEVPLQTRSHCEALGLLVSLAVARWW